MNIKEKIKWTEQHMPVVEKIRKEFIKEKPFKGLTCGVVLHLTKETAVLLMTLQDGGARIIASASNPLSTQEDIVKYLREERKMEIYGRKGMTDKEYQDGLLAVVKAKSDYVIDDGGDLHNLFNTGNFEVMPKGGLEETTTGVTRIKQMDLKYPILAVNDADTKHLFDNHFGTAQSTLDGIIRATNILLAGKTLVVAGYGQCGSGIADRARGMGCNVIVTEIDYIKALQAFMDGFRVMPMRRAVFEADIVVTVTGSINVLGEEIRNLKDGAIIANAGHFDVEINKKVLKDNFKETKEVSKDITEYTMHGYKTIYLLSDGRLVNLAAAEGHPSEIMDLSFSNQLLGLEYMVKDKGMKIMPKVYDIPKSIDEKVAMLKLEALDIEIDKETEEQINYRNL